MAGHPLSMCFCRCLFLAKYGTMISERAMSKSFDGCSDHPWHELTWRSAHATKRSRVRSYKKTSRLYPAWWKRGHASLDNGSNKFNGNNQKSETSNTINKCTLLIFIGKGNCVPRQITNLRYFFLVTSFPWVSDWEQYYINSTSTCIWYLRQTTCTPRMLILKPKVTLVITTKMRIPHYVCWIVFIGGFQTQSKFFNPFFWPLKLAMDFYYWSEPACQIEMPLATVLTSVWECGASSNSLIQQLSVLIRALMWCLHWMASSLG